MPPSRLECDAHPLVFERRWQTHVADRKIVLMALDDAQQARSVTSGCHDLDAVLLQQLSDAFPQQRAVLDDQHQHRMTASLA